MSIPNVSGLPSLALIACGYLEQNVGAGVSFQNVQGCTAASGGTGIAALAVDVPFPDNEGLVVVTCGSAPAAGVIAMISGTLASAITITTRKVSDQTVLSTPLWFAIYRRGKNT